MMKVISVSLIFRRIYPESTDERVHAQMLKVTVSKEFTVDMHFVMEEDVIQVDEVVVSANRNENQPQAGACGGECHE